MGSLVDTPADGGGGGGGGGAGGKKLDGEEVLQLKR